MGFLVPTFTTGSLGSSCIPCSVKRGVRLQTWKSGREPTSEKIVRNVRFLWVIFRTIEENGTWTWCSENFSQRVRPVVPEVIGGDPDFRRKIRGYCALGSILKFGNGIHKSTRNIERGHADVDIEHDLPEGGASGGVESLEGKKQLTEAILAILFRRETITILCSSNCLDGSTLLDDEVKGGDERLEVPLPLVQVGVAKPV